MQPHDDILGCLAALSAEELAQVRDQATILIGLGPKQVPPGALKGGSDHPVASGFGQDLYEAMSKQLKGGLGAEAWPPWFKFVGTEIYRTQYRQAAERAEQANTSWFPKQRRPERASMIVLYAQLVLDYLAERNKPATLWAATAAVGNLPQIVDHSFPGYAQAQLLGKVQALRTRPV